MKIKVFHFILDHRIGGPHIYVQRVARNLAPDVISTVVTVGLGPQTDVVLVNLRNKNRLFYPLAILINVFQIFWCFRYRKSRHHVIFDVHGAANIAPLLAARILKIPVVWHFHETVEKYRLLVAGGKILASGLSHRIVVVAKKAAEVFGLSNTTFIPGAVSLDFWSSGKVQPVQPKVVRPLRITCVANLNPLKGIDVLLSSLELVEKHCTLVIAGTYLETQSGYAEALQEHAKRLRSSNRQIVFAGWQSPEQLRDLLANTDIFVLPSRSEACPLALLEAMAAGCVCIATDVGDVRDILEDSVSGIVLPSESPQALAKAIEQVAEMSSAERQRMGKIAQANILSRYSLKVQAERHLDIYKALFHGDEGA